MDWHSISLPTILEVESSKWTHLSKLWKVCHAFKICLLKVQPLHVYKCSVSIHEPCRSNSVITSVRWKTRKKLLHLWEIFITLVEIFHVHYTCGKTAVTFVGKFNYYSCGKFNYTSGNYYTCGKFCYIGGSYYIKII